MTALAQELSQQVAAAVETAGSRVVRVVGRRRGPSSGVVVAPEGIVVTAHHVLERDEDIEVGLPDGAAVEATVVGRDPRTDLAVLRTEASGLTPADWAPTADLKVGHLVAAIARPGRSARASLGIVSAAAGEWRSPAGGRLDRYVESDVALHAGFSGSLLADLAGRPLGLNTAGLLRGASLAIPGSTVQRVAEAILAHGQVRRGYLGIGMMPVRLPADLAARAGQAAGVIVLSVEAGSPAADAGVILGDVLLSLGGAPVGGPADLLPLLEENQIGQAAAARLLRGGEPREASIVIGVRGGE